MPGNDDGGDEKDSGRDGSNVIRPDQFKQNDVDIRVAPILKNPEDQPDDEKSKIYSRGMRLGAFVAGGGFLTLAAVDAMINPFPATEKFFAGTGIALMAIGITGKMPKDSGGE